MSARRVAVTGLGLVSSQGSDVPAVFDAWCQGISGIAAHDIGEAPHSLRIPYALCSDFDAAPILGRPRLTTMDRVSQLSTVAALAAWNDAQLSELPADARDAVPVHWGTGGGGTHTTDRSYRDLFVKGRARISPLTVVLGMHNAAASQIALNLALGAECMTYSVACASSAVAIGEAFRRVRAGEADIAVAGGAEAAMPYGMAKAWESLQVMAPLNDDTAHQCRPFHAERQGLVLGEGAAALILEDWDHAQARGAQIYAEIIGYGSTCDHTHLTTPDARGQVRAIHKALRDADVSHEDVDYVNAHGTATKEGDPVESQALREAFGDHASQVAISSTKSMHGHLLGAAGAIEALTTVMALHEQRLPPTLNLHEIDPACVGLRHLAPGQQPPTSVRVALSNSFAFGGSNAVLVLRAPQEA
ncbi:MAG TPA: beta-ketoacyl-[acyl-carrier-protein] synthase family protein [Aquabacterium sp.]|nr:beta-ketoacyl-[acyl-carrier-protein] synthase family protein [Aquabacterium sp.]